MVKHQKVERLAQGQRTTWAHEHKPARVNLLQVLTAHIS